MKINAINTKFMSPKKSIQQNTLYKTPCVDSFSFKGDYEEERLNKIQSQLAETTDKNGNTFFTEERLKGLMEDIKESKIRKIDVKMLQEKLLSKIDNEYKIFFEELKPFNEYQSVAKKKIKNENGSEVARIVLLKSDGSIAKTRYESQDEGNMSSNNPNKTKINIIYRDADDCGAEIILSCDENKEPCEITSTRMSSILTNAYETTKYTLKNYPEDMDFISLIKSNQLDKKIEENNLPQGTVISKVTQKRNITSFDEKFTQNGKTTIRHYSEKQNIFGKLENYEYSYKILDENGDYLLNTNRTWQKTPTGSITTINGKKYKVEFEKLLIDDTKVNILMPDGTKKYFFASLKSKKKRTDDLIKFLKTLPADLILDIEDCFEVEIIDDGEDSNISTFLNHVKTNNDQCILSHELGHKKNKEKEVSKNKELIEIYKKEVEIFKKENPEIIKELTDYFLPESASHSNGLSELVAETNSLMTSFKHPEEKSFKLKYRMMNLSKNFPETIAKAGELLGYNKEPETTEDKLKQKTTYLANRIKNIIKL